MRTLRQVLIKSRYEYLTIIELNSKSVRSKEISKTVRRHKIILSNQMPDFGDPGQTIFLESPYLFTLHTRDFGGRCYYKDLPTIHVDHYVNVGRSSIIPSFVNAASTLLLCLFVRICVGEGRATKKKRVAKWTIKSTRIHWSITELPMYWWERNHCENAKEQHL